MKYKIRTIVMDSPGFIEIDDEEYLLIKTAIENLFEILFFEETFDLVTENYQEYEAELLLIASRGMVFLNSDYFSMSNERNKVIRRIINLLSACRMYLDQSVHHLNNIYGEQSDLSNLLTKVTTSQYENNYGYRVLEALRNYTQHRGYPIHSMKFSGEWLDIDDEESSRLSHTVIPLIKISKLAEDGKFKQSVLNEMRSVEIKDELEIRPLVRWYLEGIGKIHEEVREAIHSDVEKWEKVVDEVIKKYRKEYGSDSSLAGLAILAENDDGHWIEQRTIFKEFIEKRKILERKNKVFVNLHKRFASNEIRKK